MTPMKVIFLDFDGVLNSDPWIWEQCKKPGGQEKVLREVGPEFVALLNQLVERSGAKVVVSSSWRIIYTDDKLQEILNTAGFKGEVIGSTKSLFRRSPERIYSEEKQVERGEEIQVWLNEHTELGVKSFVILDDSDDMSHLRKTHFVHTNPMEGLTQADVDKALTILEKP